MGSSAISLRCRLVWDEPRWHAWIRLWQEANMCSQRFKRREPRENVLGQGGQLVLRKEPARVAGMRRNRWQKGRRHGGNVVSIDDSCRTLSILRLTTCTLFAYMYADRAAPEYFISPVRTWRRGRPIKEYTLCNVIPCRRSCCSLYISLCAAESGQISNMLLASEGVLCRGMLKLTWQYWYR